MEKGLNKTKKSQLKHIFIYLFVTGFGILTILYGIICWTIFSDVKEICEKTYQEFEGDIVEANIKFLQSNQHSLVEKNEVVWVSGQIGDDRALPILEKIYTSVPCEKPCNKKNKICQYELEKAIKSCRGDSFSLTRWMYRFL